MARILANMCLTCFVFALGSGPGQTSTIEDCNSKDPQCFSDNVGFIQSQVQTTMNREDAIVIGRFKLPETGNPQQADTGQSVEPELETEVKEESPDEAGIEKVGQESHGSGKGGTDHAHHHLNESFNLSAFFIFGVGACMCLLHLLHWPIEAASVKATTLRVLNMTFSIFVAILVYSLFKEILEDVFNPRKKSSAVIDLALFIVLYVGSHFILFRLKGGDKLALSAAGIILAHISGFAAMYGFSDVQSFGFIKERGVAGIVIVISIAGIVTCGLAFIMSKVMRDVALADGQLDEDERAWIDVCNEADDDVFSFAISFLIVGLMRYLVDGRLSSYHPGEVGNITQNQCNLLAWYGACSFLVVIIGVAVIYCIERPADPFQRRVFIVIQHTTSMITAWACLFYAEWQIKVLDWEKTIMGESLVVASSMTFLSLCLVLVLDVFRFSAGGSRMFQRALKSAELALGILIGFSWERAFHVGFHVIEHTFDQTNKGVGHSLMCIVLFLVVAPAWRFYILPLTIEEEKLEEKRESQSDVTGFS